MSQEFTKMMLGEDYEITEEMGDIEALQGVSQFPARIKCATLAWKALEKEQLKKKVNQKDYRRIRLEMFLSDITGKHELDNEFYHSCWLLLSLIVVII